MHTLNYDFETVDPNNAGVSPSLAFDSSSNPHISYASHAGSGISIKYASKDASGWKTEVLSTANSWYWGSIAVDVHDNLRISYGDSLGLRYATKENQAPTANAGADQTVKTKSTVQLDGSRSTDLDDDSLTYAWTLLEKPAKSKAQLSDGTIVNPTFIPDKVGTYTIQLVVTDEHRLQSTYYVVTVTASNKPPK